MKRSFLLVLLLSCFYEMQGQITNIGLDPLLFPNGEKVSIEKWKMKRWPEIHAFFTREVFGKAPTFYEQIMYRILEDDKPVFDNEAIRKQVRIYWNGTETGRYADLFIYTPAHQQEKIPLFLGFSLPKVSVAKEILQNGYGIAVINAGEISPDKDNEFSVGVRGSYMEFQKGNDNWGTISAWAWGLSRAMDYIVTDPLINSEKVAVFGFSRLGKAALWAGATDRRFAAIISQLSGAGGAKLFRHPGGESIEHLVTAFPHWFCRNFKQYSGREAELPFDQHEMMSLIAPRILYVSSADKDSNSDPEGEFLGIKATCPVYHLFGIQTSLPDKLPEINTPAGLGTPVGYHIRSGKHDVTPYDWECYIRFLNQLWK